MSEPASEPAPISAVRRIHRWEHRTLQAPPSYLSLPLPFLRFTSVPLETKIFTRLKEAMVKAWVTRVCENQPLSATPKTHPCGPPLSGLPGCFQSLALLTQRQPPLPAPSTGSPLPHPTKPREVTLPESNMTILKAISKLSSNANI